MKRILVPIDFSTASGNALRFAYEFARELSMELSLLHCYAPQAYNRPYDFPSKDYAQGIRGMLSDFYRVHIEDPGDGVRWLARPGSVVEKVALISKDYELVVISANSYDSKIQRWLGSRSSTIASTAKCPVLIVPPTATYKPWQKVWHIDRRENEAAVVAQHLPKLRIEHSIVESKSFKQTTFTSALWKSIVTYAKAPDKELHEAIFGAHEREKIDLILLVSHHKDSFQKFINDHAIHVIFQFNIPVLVLQAHS